MNMIDIFIGSSLVVAAILQLIQLKNQTDLIKKKRLKLICFLVIADGLFVALLQFIYHDS